MRTMMKVTIPAQAGSRAVKDGTMGKMIEKVLSDLRPEAAYFTAEDGDRTAFFVFDLKESAHMTLLAEPIFSVVDAKISFMPVMNPEELKKGLEMLAKR
jgi:hypothetical protein